MSGKKIRTSEVLLLFYKHLYKARRTFIGRENILIFELVTRLY